MTNREHLRVLSPWDGRLLAELPQASDKDVDHLLERARNAATSWRSFSVHDRSATLHRLADSVDEHIEELSEIESENGGKSIADARSEIEIGIDAIRYFAGAIRAATTSAPAHLRTGYFSFGQREPLGVAAIFTPWNFPLFTLLIKAGAALAAGNCIVAKPSELAPLSAIRVAELAEAVLPDGVFSVVVGGPKVGDALVRSGRVDAVAMTGSTETGRAVIRASAERMPRLQLELGGNCAAIITAGDHIATARTLASALCYHSGQACTAPRRWIVREDLVEEVVEAAAEELERYVLADRRAEHALDPIMTSKQISDATSWVDEHQHRDCTLVCPRSFVPVEQRWLPPALLVAGTDIRLPDREVFVPVATVQAYASLDHAVRLANGSEMGLAASVWGDSSRLLRVARDLDVGTVWVNTHSPVVPEMPHGGRHSSGFGKDFGAESLAFFSDTKHVMVREEDLN